MKSFSPVWISPPAGLALSTGLDIWRARLDITPPDRNGLYKLLSAEERGRAERFRSQGDRDRYVAAHGILRTLLARYLLSSPESIRFTYGPLGKPAVDGDLCFNLSHSQDLALFAVARGRAVGINVEFIRADVPAPGLVERFFSAGERAAFFAVPLAERQEEFFRQWTRREAYLKAFGSSISTLPEGLDRTDDPDQSIIQFTPAEGYVAAAVVRGEAEQPSYWQWGK